MESNLADQFSALGHPLRLAVFRLVMRRYPDAVPAGEIARALGLRANTASVHLAALTRAGLIAPHRSGRSLRYRTERGAVRTMVDELLLDCCRGRPDLCPTPPPDARPERILFLCRANSARSIMAEAILRDSGGYVALSAGTAPGAAVHPLTIAQLSACGHDTRSLRPKSMSEIAPVSPDLVLTVCDDAANAEAPNLPGRPVIAHWGVPDPVGAPEGPAAFAATYDRLRARIRALIALPLERITRAELQQAVDAIGREELTT